MAKALPFKKIIKKRRKHFDRHQSDTVIRVQVGPRASGVHPEGVGTFGWWVVEKLETSERY